MVGGAAAPLSLIEQFEQQHGVNVCHAWGMTEMSPVGTTGMLKPRFDSLSAHERHAIKLKQGRTVYGVQMKIVDDDGVEQARDGAAVGQLLVRGPWIASAYFEDAQGTAHSFTNDGWFRTGDVVTLDGDGQNYPGDIPRLFELLESSELVCGIRAERKDSWLRRSMSRLANGVRGWLLRDGVSDAGCALKVMRREVVFSLIPLKTLYSFIPAMAAAAGFRIVEAPVQHRQRHGGKTSYGLLVFLWRPLVDLMGLAWYRRRCTLTPADCRSAAARGGAR